MSLTDAPIGCAVTNKADGQPLVYTDKSCTLIVALANNSGADIPLVVGDPDPGENDPATFSFYPPKGFFTSEDISNFKLSASDWSGSAGKNVFTIACTKAGTWKAGETLKFELTDVKTAALPKTGTATIAPQNMGDNVPVSVTAPFAIANEPKEGNLSLAEVLELQLDSQGKVYRSVEGDPLTNTLFLTIKNAGATPLATEQDRQPGNPQVLVSFVYGNTSGALAPDDHDPVKSHGPVGSAWNIQVDVQSIQTGWGGFNPQWSSNLPQPLWRLQPDRTNFPVLGPAQSDSANVTFSFSEIVSMTPVGHTQMLVLFTGFAKDAKHVYDDHLFVLDIAKLDPPPTRGLISFAGVEPLIAVAKPGQRISIDLRWAMFDVAGVQLITSHPGIAPRKKPYPKPQPLMYDKDTIDIPRLDSSQAIFTTLQAFDGNGGYLNSLQFTTFAQLSYVADPDGKVYPIALVGSTFWLMANYDYGGQGDVYFYDDNPGFGPQYGRLYDLDAAEDAHNRPAAGWQLPTAEDWKALFKAYSGSVSTYVQLMAGGSSGFDGQLGGWRTVDSGGRGTFANGPGSDFPSGFYWAASDSGSGLQGVQFASGSEQIAVIPVINRKAALAVRYVRHA